MTRCPVLKGARCRSGSARGKRSVLSNRAERSRAASGSAARQTRCPRPRPRVAAVWCHSCNHPSGAEGAPAPPRFSGHLDFHLEVREVRNGAAVVELISTSTMRASCVQTGSSPIGRSSAPWGEYAVTVPVRSFRQAGCAPARLPIRTRRTSASKTSASPASGRCGAKFQNALNAHDFAGAGRTSMTRPANGARRTSARVQPRSAPRARRLS